MNLEKIGIIGFGRLGSTLAKTLVRERKTIIVYSPRIKKISIKSKNILVAKNPKEIVKKSKIIFWSVRPEHTQKSLSQIEKFVKKKHIFISCVAGANYDSLKNRLNTTIIVTRPPITIMTKTGFIPFYAKNKKSKRIAKKILSNFGTPIYVQEKDLGKINHLTCCMPAIIAKICKEIIKASNKTFKVNSRKTEMIFSQALIGVGKLIEECQLTFTDIEYLVCTPGGITKEGIKTLNKYKIKKIALEIMKSLRKGSKKAIKKARKNNI